MPLPRSYELLPSSCPEGAVTLEQLKRDGVVQLVRMSELLCWALLDRALACCQQLVQAHIAPPAGGYCTAAHASTLLMVHPWSQHVAVFQQHQTMHCQAPSTCGNVSLT